MFHLSLWVYWAKAVSLYGWPHVYFFGFNCFSYVKLKTALLVWSNPNQLNRRSAIHNSHYGECPLTHNFRDQACVAPDKASVNVAIIICSYYFWKAFYPIRRQMCAKLNMIKNFKDEQSRSQKQDFDNMIFQNLVILWSSSLPIHLMSTLISVHIRERTFFGGGGGLERLKNMTHDKKLVIWEQKRDN